MDARSNRGSSRAVIVVALSATALAAVAAFVWLAPRRSNVTHPAAPQPVVSKVLPPAIETPAPAPAPPPAGRRRSNRPAGAGAAAPAPEPTERRSDRGILKIESDVPAASVFIDRVYVGTTPVTARDIVPGRHQLNASVQGYDGISDRIEVEAGEKTLTVRFKEVRLDAAVDVVHKHGIGSCRGRLAATPDGMRYEPTTGGDAFSAPLAALDEFSVDYLKKTLHVKVRGRAYNFTDPDGNADRLFVFHRDVEKARQKLAAR